MATPAGAVTSEVVRYERSRPGFGVLATAAALQSTAFYAMSAFLVPYLIDPRGPAGGWQPETAADLNRLLARAIGVTPLLGAAVADRLLGQRRAVVAGLWLTTLGLVAVCFPAPSTVAAAVALVAVGQGLFGPAIYAMLGRLHDEDDRRRDGAFTLFMLPPMLGAVLGVPLCMGLGTSLGWRWGFAAVAAMVAAGSVLLLARTGGLRRERWTRSPFAPDGSRAQPSPGAVRDHLRVLVAVAVLVALFGWSSQLARDAAVVPGQPLTVFAARGAGGAVLSIVFVPLLAWLWNRLARKDKDLDRPSKIALGMALSGASILAAAGGDAAGAHAGPLSASTLSAAVLAGAGRVCFDPIALSMVTRLAPVRWVALSVAGWWLVTSVPATILPALAPQVGRFGGSGPWTAIAACLVPAAILLALRRSIVARTHV